MGLILDIETAPDLADEAYVKYKSATMVNKTLKDPVKVEADRLDKINDNFALMPLTGKITAIGFMSDYKPDNVSMTEIEHLDTVGRVWYKVLTLADSTEEEMLIAAWRIIGEYMDDGHRLVSYNGREFDIPFMVRRSMLLQVGKPSNLPSLKDLNNQYSTRYHLDLFHELHTYNERRGFKFIAQQEWAYRMGLVNEIKGSHGAECIAMYQTGDWGGIIAHLLSDLTKTMLLQKRTSGWVDANEFE